MARRRKKKVRSGGDWQDRSFPGSAPTGRKGGPSDLILEVRRLLRSPDPLDLIAYVSTLLAALDPRRVNPMDRRGDDDGPGLHDIVRSFAEIEMIETSALLAVAEVLVDDEDLRQEIRRRRAGRPHILPSWLARLGEAAPYRTVETVHVLGDGENVVVGVRLAEGHELTSLLYIDHNLGTAAKDGFVVGAPIDSIVAMFMNDVDEHTSANDIAPADARARMTEAIKRGDMMFPPFETETWPGAQPVVEWIARLLPEGGKGFERPEWTEKATKDLARRFFASPDGRSLDNRDHRDLMESILWYGTDYGPGDPMRWSAPAAEILLLDWIPRKIVADVDFLLPAPHLLSAFVRFCDAERGIPPELTRETLGAIALFASEYREIISSPRLQGPAALLAMVGALDPDEAGWLSAGNAEDGLPSYEEIMLDSVRAAVGGDEALRLLDDRPLPDEPFDPTGIPDDIVPKVSEVLALCDECCTALFDLECRTACRRFLTRVAVGDPQIFRRKARSDTAAAALVWIVGKANGLFGGPGGRHVKELAAHLGVAQPTVSQRAKTMLAAAGISDRFYGNPILGSPDLLTSARRREIMTMRDRFSSPD